MTAEFVASGGGVVRVRHARVDAGANHRLVMTDGRLGEVSADA
jgi:hypothetical protein